MIDDIVSNIERSLALRRFDNPEFAAQLQDLQLWQQERMAETYWVLQDRPAEADLINFFLTEIYSGVDLRHLGRKVGKTAKLIDKLFTDLQLLHIAIEFNALNAELDEALTQSLYEDMGVNRITEADYIKAFQRVDPDARQHQLTLLRAFAAEARDSVNDSFVYNAFKLAKYPAKLGGLGSLHQMVFRGFKAMRRVERPCDIIGSVLNHEQSIYTAIYNGDSEPFTRYSANTLPSNQHRA